MGARAAVIGAGVAGLACARRLAAAGMDVVVFDKGRGPGGRVSTRRAGDLSCDHGAFDHGAPGFAADRPGFASVVERLAAAGAVAPWSGQGLAGDPTHTGVPGMNALARALAEGLDLRASARIARVSAGSGGWTLTDDAGAAFGGFDMAAVAIPGPQAADLLAVVPDLAAVAAGVVMEPRCTTMLAFDRPLDGLPDVLGMDRPELALAIRDSAKPGRGGGERWVLHAGAAWSAAMLDRPFETIAAAMAAAFPAAAAPVHAAAHRWRYALVARPAGAPFLLDQGKGIGACGDWCLGATVGDAWASGDALGAAMVEDYTSSH